MKQRGQWRLVLILMMSFFMGSALTHTAFAADDASEVGFSVKAELPKNQIDQKQSYFDLKVQPGDEQTVKMAVYNSSNKAMKIKNEIHAAHTNANGQIEYVTPAKKQDKTLKQPLTKWVTLHEDKVITVPENSEKTLTATIKVPKDATKGVALGAWYFERVVKDQQTKEAKGMTINNRYGYAVGMKLTVDHTVSPKLALNDVKPGLRNYRKGIFANLQNSQPAIISGLTVTGKVYREGSNKVVKEAKLEHVGMAPNSNFDFPILYGKDELLPGKYVVKMTAKNSDHQWSFTKKMTITSEDASKVNKKALDKAPERNVLWYVAGGVLLAIVVGGLIWIIVRFAWRRQEK
ncbi:DUF916 and DUF3324 domain-containing protein [Furfurilactobacillus entadae]|uniref:DUF916 and DUF3324 domain-containing protein n=1 Tax=Furfurilactobacillus entadae TaxID=2922307 RepID=UPI0035EAB0F4